jgi:UDP-glucose 4-epimerase
MVPSDDTTGRPSSPPAGAAPRDGDPTARSTRLLPEPREQRGRVVAVTGAWSFIGAELLKTLEGDVRFGRLLALDVRAPAFALDKTRFIKVDLTNPTADAELAALFRREGVDTVVHAAFLSAPTHNSGWAHELEAIGTLHVLNACAATEIRKLVFWSQTLVYGARRTNPNFLTEEHELKGAQSASRFVRDKAKAEEQLRRFRRENPETLVTTLRTAPTLGPTIRNFATRFFSRPVAPVLMGYDPLLQFVHERDVVEAFVRAVVEDFPGEYNIVGPGVLPYSTVLAMMGRIALPLPTALARPLSEALWGLQLVDTPPNLLDFLRYLCVADGAKAARVLGFRARHDIRATITSFLGVPDQAAASPRVSTRRAAEGGGL